MFLVRGNNLTRLQWKLGRVIDVYTGQDGVISYAKVKLSEPTLTQPANTLCILENVKRNIQMTSFLLRVEDVSTENRNISNLVIVLCLFCDMLLSYSEY